MTIQQIDLVFHRCDLDKDGKLSFNEFERWGKQKLLWDQHFCKSIGQKFRAAFWGENRYEKFFKHRMMKRHMVGASGLTIEESERMVEEAETDEETEEIEEQVKWS